MSATTYAANFEAAVAAADLDAEIAAYKAEQARPDFIYYSCVANGFVFGNATTAYPTYTAADIARSAPIPTPTPMPQPGDFDDGELCTDCRQPADDRCYDCRIDLCVTCNERWHRHGQPASSRRNGAAFFDRQRAVAAFRTSTIESHLDRARRHAAEVHGDLGDAGYSEHVQRGVDELFN